MKYTEEEMDAYFFGERTPEDWPSKCQEMFSQVRAERDTLKRLERERWERAQKVFGPEVGPELK